MRKICTVLLTIIFILAIGAAAADSETNIPYVMKDWNGYYTGQVDTNRTPFGFGVFVSTDPINDALWHYIGAWEDGLPEGDGAIYFEDGTIYQGIFSQGTLVDGWIYKADGLSAEPVKQDRAIVPTETLYIGNKNSKRFHLPTCRSVTQMSEKNKVEFSSREEAIANHYTPCGDCNP